MSLDRAALLKPIERKTEKVELPEFGKGAFVYVAGMNAREKNAHDSALMNRKFDGLDPVKVKTQKERMVICCVRDKAGKKVFQPQDVEALGNWPSDTLNRVFDVANRLSGGGADQNSVKNSDETGDD